MMIDEPFGDFFNRGANSTFRFPPKVETGVI